MQKPPAGAPEMPESVLVMVRVPPSFRGLAAAEVRRKLAPPANVGMLLDELAEAVVRHFNAPVDYDQIITALAAARPDGGPRSN